MPIFRLEAEGSDYSKGELVAAEETELELEAHLESWLENSPWALIPGEAAMWIGRQTSANVEAGTIFPDLLGVDIEGNLVVVELKRGRAPREVTAQLLEYAAWADGLSDEQIDSICEAYLGRPFREAFADAFDLSEDEEPPPLNRRLRLFVVAGSLPPSVSAVCRFLRTAYGVDIHCIRVSIFQTEDGGETIVSMESEVGHEETAAASKTRRQSSPPGERWSEDIPVREAVLEAVQQFTEGNSDILFTPKDILNTIRVQYPSFKASTVNGQLIAGTSNHPSQKHHRIKPSYYWRVEQGKYRLYDPERDGSAETT